MSVAPHDLDDRDLTAALRDVGEHLDLGPGATVDGRAALVTAVLDRLERLDAIEPTEPTATRGRGGLGGDRGGRGRGPLLVAAIAVVVVGIGLFALAPAREAIAGWFGVDGLRITRTDDPPPAPDTAGPDRPTVPTGEESKDPAALADRLPFPLLLPASEVAGPPVSARIDPGVPSGLIEVRYRDFTLVALASQPGGRPTVSKEIGPATTVEAVTVDGRPGLWLTGAPHQVSFIDPDGAVVLDSVRRAGDVLIWQHDGVTYRIEGLTSLAAALQVATALS